MGRLNNLGKNFFSSKKDLRDIIDIVLDSQRNLFLKIFCITALGLLIASLDSVGLSLFIPILQKILNPTNAPASTAFGFLNPLLDFAPSSPTSQILFISVVMVSSFLLKGILEWGQTSLNTVYALQIANHWRPKMFSAITHASLEKIHHYKLGHLQNLVTIETEHIRSIFSSLLIIFSAAIIIISYLIVLLFLSPKLLLITLLLVLFGLVPVVTFIRKILKTGYDRVKTRTELASLSLEIFNSLRIVHLFKTFEFEKERFQNKIDEYSQQEISMYQKKTIIPALDQVVGAVTGCSIIIIGINFSGIIEPAHLVLFVGLFIRLSASIQQMNSGITALSKVYSTASAFKTDHDEIFSLRQKNGTKILEAKDYSIQFKNVYFSYNEDSPTLQDINLKIEPGKHYGILGPSGSGKSTLANLILKLSTPQHGTISVNGNDLNELEVYHWRNIVGLVEQSPTLINESILENIRYGKQHATLEELHHSAKLARADSFIENMPSKYDTSVGSMGNLLSGGQRQRISIARTLLVKPKILIFDEATSSVDVESERYIEATIKSLVEAGTTVINITHKIHNIHNFDYIYFIKNGKIEKEGTPFQFTNIQSYFKENV